MIFTTSGVGALLSTGEGCLEESEGLLVSLKMILFAFAIPYLRTYSLDFVGANFWRFDDLLLLSALSSLEFKSASSLA